MLGRGPREKQDFKRAAHLLEMASNLGHAEATAMRTLLIKSQVMNVEEHAGQLHQRLCATFAEDGSGLALFCLATLFDEYDRALSSLMMKSAAEKDYGAAKTVLAEKLIDVDHEGARTLLLQAAQVNDARGLRRLAIDCKQGTLNGGADAIMMFLQAAQFGDAYSMRKVAKACAHNGDHLKFAQWMTRYIVRGGWDGNFFDSFVFLRLNRVQQEWRVGKAASESSEDITILYFVGKEFWQYEELREKLENPHDDLAQRTISLYRNIKHSAKYASLLTMFALQSLLTKDVARLIAKLVFETREKKPALWFT